MSANEPGQPVPRGTPVDVTIDLAVPDGAAIPIEQRSADEVTGWRGARAAADGVAAWNPAFDVTPAELVSAIVTDRGVVPPSQLSRLMD